ncbi:hypothetical protein SB394_16705 [Burkholderia sp. BCCIQ04A]|uniref:Uncharacterized protein n=1 Tax=Burkholderia anthinoferrum TaxID=3090833 RepID=A0ABU5WK96_9BURK|nr:MULTISPECIES: hypothetical protein [Burkholderia]MEB2503655.1 hypothetical protein [Burkholderia anthinoferrum]MEB2535095.1 hypothetical protein [Burkholderia anthinoferrum]MEB2560875.1 hypothetical protein [Burkholderia anthinoferrum]MEB2579421.1 hypothetical protein [Burkholderia anthinoferrum]MDF3098904.1 hypothetical protein [Burkholderia semiarida]
MSKSEGISRIAKVLRGIGWLVILAAAAIMLGNKNLDGAGVVVGVLVAAIIAAPCFAVAWIVDGFAK